MTLSAPVWPWCAQATCLSGPCTFRSIRLSAARPATLLAREGRHVVMLEKAHHPRFHIGESLLPANVALFDALGLRAEVAYLAAHALGVGCTGIGAFYDLETVRFFNLSDTTAIIYELAIGVPA